MATYSGDFNDFEKFIGPRLRNIVQTSISRKHKKKVGKCENKNCQNTEFLEAAHVHGKGRKELLKIAYDNNVANGTIDLIKFEKDFKDLHDPAEHVLLILCKSCHKKYDSISEETNSTPTEEEENEEILEEKTNNAPKLEIELYPPDPIEFKELLLQYKSADIQINYLNGTEKVKRWNATNFAETSNILGNLRSRSEFKNGQWRQDKIKNISVRINY